MDEVPGFSIIISGTVAPLYARILGFLRAKVIGAATWIKGDYACPYFSLV